MFSSKSFIVWPYIRYLIHFEVIFLLAVKKCSNIIILHGAVQFSKHYVLKRLPFIHCIFLPPLQMSVAH